MEQRILGRTGRAVSVTGLGTWQLGADSAIEGVYDEHFRAEVHHRW